MPWAWRELHDGSQGALWAGQSPHLLWLTPPADSSAAAAEAGDASSAAGEKTGPLGYMLGLAGGYYVEDFGGADCHLICDAVVLEWVGGRQGLRAIYAVDQYGEPHPKLHGAAKAALPDGSFLFFGGGNPGGSTNVLTRLSVHSSLRQPRPNPDEVRGMLEKATQGSSWVAIQQPDGRTSLAVPHHSQLPVCWSSISVEDGPAPLPRHGLHATVSPGTGDFLIFGGRGDSRSTGCFNDLWSLSLSRDHGRWNQVPARGAPPPAKVWYGAATTRSGMWVIYGGSQWQFDEDSTMDRGVIYILALQSLTWSTLVPPASSPMPELAVACALVESGGSILLLGGCMPHRLNSVTRERATAFQLCPNWYVPLTQVWRCDLEASAALGTAQWQLEDASADEVPEPGDTTLRSHLAAVAAPVGLDDAAGPRALVFGGSRYFTGAYFHDLLELRYESSSANISGETEARAPLDSPARWSLWQRLRPGSAARSEGTASTGSPARRPSLERLRASGTRRGSNRSDRARPATGQRGSAGRLRAMARDGLMM